MKTLLIDLETSAATARVWGLWNQNIGINQIVAPGSTLCAAYKWLGEPDKKVKFVSSWDTGFASMIAQLHEAMDEADAVVTYNGNRFDIPTLQREFLLGGLPPPSPSKSIDLYRTVKRQFRFASNKLDFVCQQLGLGAKTHHKGMDLWTGVEAGDAASRKTMTAYNKQDVFLLEKLYHRLLPWIPNHPNVSLYNNSTVASCTNCGSSNIQKRGVSHSKVATYQRYQCSDCGGWSRERLADKEISRKHLLVRDNGG